MLRRILIIAVLWAFAAGAPAEARPATDLDPAALALVAEVARRRHKVLFRGAETDAAERSRRYGAA